MSIDAALLIARSGLLHTQRALSNAADNVANAETEGYTRKRLPTASVNVGGQGMGVVSIGPLRDVDTALVTEIQQRNSDVAAGKVRDAVLARINQAHGDPAKGEALGDLVSMLRSAFIELRYDPSQVVKQQAVVLNASQQLVQRFNDLSRVVGDARQAAQNDIVTEIRQVNATLREIAGLTREVMTGIGAGKSTADIEDRRDLALNRLSASIGFKTFRQPSGDLILLGAGGIAIPLPDTGEAFSTLGMDLAPNAFYGAGGSVPPIMLNQLDVTEQIKGGRLGEFIQLRDQTLTRYQAEMDIAAVEIAARFEGEGLRLFTDSNGTVPNPDLGYAAPGSAQIGFANRIQINALVRADSTLLRNGTHSIPAVPPATIPWFTPNPADGPAGFTLLVDRILENSFGDKNSKGENWGGFATAGLGPDGKLSSPFASPKNIEDYAVLVTALQTSDSSAAAKNLETSKQLVEGLEARFTRESRVDVDSEMAFLIQLQNAYAANARVMSTAQTMWETLFGSVR
jgi:flagellar hook-associated protein 1 FlgK